MSRSPSRNSGLSCGRKLRTICILRPKGCGESISSLDTMKTAFSATQLVDYMQRLHCLRLCCTEVRWGGARTFRLPRYKESTQREAGFALFAKLQVGLAVEAPACHTSPATAPRDPCGARRNSSILSHPFSPFESAPRDPPPAPGLVNRDGGGTFPLTFIGSLQPLFV